MLHLLTCSALMVWLIESRWTIYYYSEKTGVFIEIEMVYFLNSKNLCLNWDWACIIVVWYLRKNRPLMTIIQAQSLFWLRFYEFRKETISISINYSLFCRFSNLYTCQYSFFVILILRLSLKCKISNPALQVKHGCQDV